MKWLAIVWSWGLFLNLAHADIRLNAPAGQDLFKVGQIRNIYINHTQDGGRRLGVYIRLVSEGMVGGQRVAVGDSTEVYIPLMLLKQRGMDAIQFGQSLAQNEIDVGLYVKADPIFSRQGRHTLEVQDFAVAFKLPNP
ncbi:MAG: hypothetical protein AB7N80_10360 [Bdellovibrionales bacterium]